MNLIFAIFFTALIMVGFLSMGYLAWLIIQGIIEEIREWL